MPTAVEEILELTRRLLAAVAAGDWKSYCELVSDDITCFEPEARGYLVTGLPFHEFYFRLPSPASDGKPQPPAKPVTTTLTAPVVKLLAADVAVVAYVRLTQTLDDAGKPVTRSSEETRIWQKRDGHWKHVHFHRSLPS